MGDAFIVFLRQAAYGFAQTYAVVAADPLLVITVAQATLSLLRRKAKHIKK